MFERRHARRVILGSAAVVVAIVTAAAPISGDRKSEASWVAVCPGAPEVASTYRTTYESATGARTTLLVSASAVASPDCATVRLPVAATTIVWARLVTAATAKRLGAGFLLQGGVNGGPSANSEIIPLDTPDPPPSPSTPSAQARASSSNTPARGRSMWAWRPELWRDGGSVRLLTRAAAWQADTLSITVPTTPTGEVVAADELRQFLREAARRGVHVWAVDGDPRAVLPSERASFETRAGAYRRFNAAASDTERLAGIQYDIEPYLVAGYHLDEDGWQDAYVATIAGLARAASGLPIELAAPFWWLDANGDGTNGDGAAASFVDRLAPSIASVAIMDYRTDAALIERFARPWLAWGARHRKRIRVALEAGPWVRTKRARRSGNQFQMPTTSSISQRRAGRRADDGTTDGGAPWGCGRQQPTHSANSRHDTVAIESRCSRRLSTRRV